MFVLTTENNKVLYFEISPKDTIQITSTDFSIFIEIQLDRRFYEEHESFNDDNIYDRHVIELEIKDKKLENVDSIKKHVDGIKKTLNTKLANKDLVDFDEIIKGFLLNNTNFQLSTEEDRFKRLEDVLNTPLSNE